MTESKNRHQEGREPARAGEAWSDVENTQLVDGVRRGWSVRQLATAHGRTDKAITKQVESMTPADQELRGSAAVGWLRARLDMDPAYDWRAPLRERRAVYWSTDDDAELRAAWGDGLDLPLVADRLGRSELELHHRLVALGLSANEVETVERMGTEAGSVLELRSRQQRGQEPRVASIVIASGILNEERSGFHVSQHWAREAAWAELRKIKETNRALADADGVMPGEGSWVLAVRVPGLGNTLVAGPDQAGTFTDGSV